MAFHYPDSDFFAFYISFHFSEYLTILTRGKSLWAEGMPSIKAPGFWVEQNVRGKVADDSDAVDGCVGRGEVTGVA